MSFTLASLPRALALALTAALGALALLAPSKAAALDEPAMIELLKEVDVRQRNSGDWKALAYMQQKEKGKSDVAYEMVIYRRDADEKLMFLFMAPKSEAGKGYLRIDDNIWMYDPNVGKWERRTERERIGGTDSRRADFDQSKLAVEYTPTYLGADKLGKFDVHKLKLAVKAGRDVAWPIIELWVDQATGNVLKRQEFALSGKLMRTALYPKWHKVYSESKQADVWYPKQMYFYDEVEKGNQTIVSIKDIDLRGLDKNMFTKAWLESKSR